MRGSSTVGTSANERYDRARAAGTLMGNWYHVEVTSSLPVRRRLAELSGSSPSSSTAKSSSLSEVRDFSSRTARVPKNCFPLTGLRCRLLTRASCSFALECRYGEAISASRHSRERGCFRALDAFGAAGGGGGPGIAIDAGRTSVTAPGGAGSYTKRSTRLGVNKWRIFASQTLLHKRVHVLSLSLSLYLSLCTFVSLTLAALSFLSVSVPGALLAPI